MVASFPSEVAPFLWHWTMDAESVYRVQGLVYFCERWVRSCERMMDQGDAEESDWIGLN